MTTEHEELDLKVVKDFFSIDVLSACSPYAIQAQADKLFKLLDEKEDLCKAQQRQIDLCKADIQLLREAIERALLLSPKIGNKEWFEGVLQETAIFEAESTNPENRESDK